MNIRGVDFVVNCVPDVDTGIAGDFGSTITMSGLICQIAISILPGTMVPSRS